MAQEQYIPAYKNSQKRSNKIDDTDITIPKDGNGEITIEGDENSAFPIVAVPTTVKYRKPDVAIDWMNDMNFKFYTIV